MFWLVRFIQQHGGKGYGCFGLVFLLIAFAATAYAVLMMVL